MTALVTPALAAWLTPAVFAGEYHVSPAGDDAASGRRNQPFRTLARAADAAGPGDTIVVHDGVYGHEGVVTGGDSADYAASPVVLRRSGTPQAWITIKAEHKWRAVLDCEMLCDSYIDLRNSAYVAIQDFVITRGYKEGIHSNDAAHHIVLRGNRIENIALRPSSSPLGLSGLYTGPACHHFVIDGNIFRGIGRSGGPPGNLDHGLYLRGGDLTVTNNVFYDIFSGWPIQVAGGVNNILIANNTFAFSNPGRAGQIMLWETQSGVTIRNNLFYQPGDHAIVRWDSTMLGPCLAEFNLLVGGKALFADAAGCTLRENRSVSGGVFINVISPPYDFHLLPGSPAIGAGAPDQGVAVDFDGLPRDGSRDVGAFRH